MDSLPEMVDGLPNICGSEGVIDEAIGAQRTRSLSSQALLDLPRLRSAFAVALHMHQPLIPAGGPDLHTAKIISNLQEMMDSPSDEQRYNAGIFRWCYKRIGEFIPQLVGEGKQPRMMLDYSGTLLWGFQHMALNDVLDSLKGVTCDPRYQDCVEWLGTAWGHAVAPSTPVQDFRLHVRAWQHHFAALFGIDALKRVRGFSPPEMALPNHPDVAYEFVKTLRDCGYQWVLVQEHSVETQDGTGLDRKHLPHRLICRNSEGKSAEIIAVIKTQGSDTKLVAQMQPYYEAKSLSHWELDRKSVPPLVTQIADGENGGVMMNEFPAKYIEVMRECSGSETPVVNVSEYLESLFANGIREADLPGLQPISQGQIWKRFTPGDGAEKLASVVEQLQKEDSRFHVEGGSWTNNVSWVQGYQSLLDPMQKLSALFNEKVLTSDISTSELRYRNALFHLLTSQTSCYRYWGQGTFVDYGREICRRGTDVLIHDF